MARPLRLVKAARARIGDLRRCCGGVAAIEFAMTLPVLLMLGLAGLEMCNRTIVAMQVNQLAVQVADNASRIGDASVLTQKRIFEEEINDLFHGAELQGGNSVEVFRHGRVIISSLEVWQSPVHQNTVRQSDGVQFISWQRCAGSLARQSRFGGQNSAQPRGLGPLGEEVLATTDSPVIFVEIYYEYEPLIDLPVFQSDDIYASAAFMVRDERDQSQVYKRNSLTTPANCNTYSEGII